jgi:chromosome segregation ATPase
MSVAARSSASTSLGNRKPREIKPSDVYDLRLQTQQMVLRTRRLRTHLRRCQQRILANTNAINKTFEQQSDEPSVVTKHENTTANIKRSVDSAENTLESLQEQIEEAREHDKTYIVKELQEEVKLLYCEHQRLAEELRVEKIRENQLAARLAEAEQRASTQHLSELKAEIRSLHELNASRRDKAVAYHLKRERLLVEYQIKEHVEKKVPTAKTVEESQAKIDEINNDLRDEVQASEQKKGEHRKKLTELRQLVEEQKQKILDFLESTAELDVTYQPDKADL